MDKLNRLNVLCVVITLFVAGCGKKKAPPVVKECRTVPSKSLGKELAQVDLLDDDDFAEFAFLDDEILPPEAEKRSDGALVTQNNDDFDLDLETELLPDEGTESNFAFKPVMFDFNKNSIRADQKAVVVRDVEIAQQAVDQGKKVVVEGHSCQIGSSGYNVALSQRRAEAVKTELVKNGIPSENVKTVGYGNERPLVWSDAENRSQLLKDLGPNRRAEILVN